MSKLEQLDASNWEEFLKSDVAFLMLGKSDCAACNEWTEELTQFLASDKEFENVRFGKVLLDKPGLAAFKKANPWLADVDSLPFNVIYIKGNREKSYAGSGIERLTNRLNRLLQAGE